MEEGWGGLEREVTQEKEKYIEIEGYCMTLPAFKKKKKNFKHIQKKHKCRGAGEEDDIRCW